MDKYTATQIAASHDIPLGRDFHSLDSDIVSRIADAAKAYEYRKPKNANGSRARYFYALLCRAAA